MGDEKCDCFIADADRSLYCFDYGTWFSDREAWNRKDRGQQGSFHGDDLSGFALRDDPCFSD